MRAASLFPCAVLALLTGCVSFDEDAQAARAAVLAGSPAAVLPWAEDLATESSCSKSLGMVEAGRLSLLAGEPQTAERWFRAAVDTAVNRQEREPTIKLGDLGSEVLAATVTDDRTRDYHLAPYEINLALQYAILSELINGRREDALVDARLAVYVQDCLARTYGEDLAKASEPSDAKAASAGADVSASQTSVLREMMASARNSWENPVLWWLTGALFEADGEMEMAVPSYLKAAACRPDNPVFAKDAARATRRQRAPAAGQARLLVIYEEGLVPQRQSLKVPVPVYTAMAIDIPTYGDKSPYCPGSVAISGRTNLVAAAPALDVRALAARDLSERMPGVVIRAIARAAVQAGAQAAVNAGGNEYAQLAVLTANAFASAVRRADTRSWVSLPDGQQVWSEDALPPGTYQLGLSVNGREHAVPVTLAPNDVKLLWIAQSGATFATAAVSLR